MVDVNIISRLAAAFPRSLLTQRAEFVADPRGAVNSYFVLQDCETEEDVIAKVLEWLSRDAFKSLHFSTMAANRKCWEYHLNGINSFCGTKFTPQDMGYIYTHLGNACNHKKTLAFIRSGYDLTVLIGNKWRD